MADEEPITNQNQTLDHRLFTELQEAIVRGDIKPGSKINEASIVARYGVSRGPVREAIRRLEERQLLTRTPFAGVRVCELTREDLQNIYQVRVTLESMAAGLAAKDMTADDIEAMRTLLERHKQQIADGGGASYYQQEGDMDFHYRIVMSCRNSVLRQVYESELYHRIRRYRFQLSMVSGRPRRALAEHERIFAAIAARDSEVAELLMRRHLQQAARYLESLTFGGSL